MTAEQLRELTAAYEAERRAMTEHPDATVRADAQRWLRECGYLPAGVQLVNKPTAGKSFVATVAEKMEASDGD